MGHAHAEWVHYLSEGANISDEHRVATAGAYVRYGSVFPFMVGPTAGGDMLGVVRLGGHRETSETPWECAVREVREEASIAITAEHPSCTYWLGSDDDPSLLRKVDWVAEGCDTTPPFLDIERPSLPGCPLSVMYLARATAPPTPSGESHGLLMLTVDDVYRVVSGEMTLRGYIERGGVALFSKSLPLDLRLVPFLQLRMLSILLGLHPDLK